MLADMKVLALLVAVLLAEVMSEKADKYEAKILKMHNDYRKQQKSSNIDKLVSSCVFTYPVYFCLVCSSCACLMRPPSQGTKPYQCVLCFACICTIFPVC